MNVKKFTIISNKNCIVELIKIYIVKILIIYSRNIKYHNKISYTNQDSKTLDIFMIDLLEDDDVQLLIDENITEIK